MFTRLVEENLQSYQLSTASLKGFPTSKQLPRDMFCLTGRGTDIFLFDMGDLPVITTIGSEIVFSDIPPNQCDLPDPFRMHSRLYYFPCISSPSPFSIRNLVHLHIRMSHKYWENLATFL